MDNDFRRLRNERREVRQSVLMEGAGEPLRRIIMTDWIRPESRERENSMRDSLRPSFRPSAAPPALMNKAEKEWGGRRDTHGAKGG